MGRYWDVEQLVSARAITERLGYRNVQVVHFWWCNDPTFPAPVYALEGQRGARLWYWPEVQHGLGQRPSARVGRASSWSA